MTEPKRIMAAPRDWDAGWKEGWGVWALEHADPAWKPYVLASEADELRRQRDLLLEVLKPLCESAVDTHKGMTRMVVIDGELVPVAVVRQRAAALIAAAECEGGDDG